MLVWIGVGLASSTLAAVLLVLLERGTTPPAEAIDEVFGRPRMSGETLVACLGDDHTHGGLGGDWVQALRDAMAAEGRLFLNAGVVGDGAAELAARLDPILACDPDEVVILIGSRDALRGRAGVAASGGGPARPGIDAFESELRGIVRRIKDAGRARIALCTLIPLGEGGDPETVGLVAAYNAAVGAVAQRERVSVLDLHRAFTEAIDDLSGPPLRGRPEGPFGPSALLRLLGLGWDRVAALRGGTLLHDGYHLSDAGAAIVARVVQEHLRERDDPGAPEPPF